jgi:hypothetical protein
MMKSALRVGEWIASAFVGVILSVLFQPTVEDARKWVIRIIWPEPTTFEATARSGCSGGELRSLMTRSKAEGLRFLSEARVRNTLLCHGWSRTDDARGILEHMASRFDGCFKIERDGSYPVLEVVVDSRDVCRTDFALDASANEWKRKPGSELFLCVGGAGQQGRAGGRECTQQELILLGFLRQP